MVSQVDQQEPIARVCQGDRLALGQLYDQYTGLLFPVALRILGDRAEAEDALQDCWIQVWRRASDFDPVRGTLEAWLLTIVRSRALDRLRSLRSRHKAVEKLAHVMANDGPEGADEQQCAVEEHEPLEAVLDGLRQEERDVLRFAYFEGLSQSEIATRLSIPLGTVKTWMRRGLLALRARMARGGRNA